jgi:O-antigen biosynthesis protein
LARSVCPETYSYTVSAAIAGGLHPVVFDLGVPAERLRALGWGTVLPIGTSAAAVNAALLATEEAPCPSREALQRFFVRYGSVLRDYYGLDLPRRR